MDLFEGLDVHLGRQQNAAAFVPAADREPRGPVVPLCCAQQVLAVSNGDEVVSVQLFASGEVGQQSQGAIPLRAAVQSAQQLPQLQQYLPWDSSGGSCLLFLLQDGATLSLHTSVHAAGEGHNWATVSAARAGVAAAAASKQLQLQLLATFHHEGFASLQPADCHILPGPALLLQPEPEQLLLFLPSGGALSIQAAALQGCLPPQQQGVHTAGTSDVQPSAWQLSELHLSAETLLQTLERDFSHLLPTLLHPGRSSSQSAIGRSGQSTLAAVGRWQLLHSCLQQDSLQLLISLPVACAQRDQHPLQQEFVLVYRLQVQTVQHHSAASGGAGLQVTSCQALHWQALPSCATVHPPFCTPAGSSHQLAAVCSEAGDLQVLSLDTSSSSSSSGRYTPQGPHLQLPGAGRSVVHLPSVHVSGCSHQGVLAVLHEQPIHPHRGTLPNSSSSRLAVTLLKLHGAQLQELATVQGATGLCAPSNSPVGTLCPWQPAHQQPLEQQQQQDAYTDSSTLRLSAIISLDSSSKADTYSSLGRYAWLGPGQAAGLPGPLLGVLTAGPHCQQAEHNAQAGAAAARTAQASSLEQEDNELQGLQAMLKVLEDRWQQDTRELCVLQRRVVTAQRLAAAGHRQLCQMAADTLYRSPVRQFVSSVSSGGIDGALAVYHAGRQLAAQQPTPAAAVLCRVAAGEGPVRQLLLEVVSVDSKLTGHLLQLQVSVRPVLQYSQPSQHAAGGQVAQQQQQAGASLQHRAEDAAVGDGTTSTQPHVWQGPLLQPCHAELLLWHASTSGVPAASSWSWDAISGVLTITASITTSSLLQLHNSSEALRGGQLWAPAGCLPQQQQQQLSTAGAALQMGASTSQVDVAQAIAAAASRAACGTTYAAGSSDSGNNSARLAPWEVVQVHAAVAVSACCSSQAVAQWEGQRQQQQSSVQWALQQSDMLTPAMALLHMQPFEVPLEQLLLQQLMGTAARPSQVTKTGLEQAVPGAAGDPVQHTPLKTTAATLPPAAEGAAPGGSSMRVPGSMACTAAAPDVVPPTPCSGDDSYNGPGVIPDSQEGEDDSQSTMQHVWQQQAPQAAAGAAGTGRPTAHSAAAGAAKAACLDAAAAALGNRGSAREVMAHQPAAEAPGAPLHPMASVDRCAGVGSSRTHLLVRSQKADLHQVSELLQSKPCFQAHCSRAAVPGAQDPPSTRGGVQLGAGLELVVLQFHDFGVTAPCSSGTHSFCSGAITLLFLSPNVLHATLAAGSKPCLCALEQLLLLAIKQFSQDHGDITTERSYLDPSLLACLDAAMTSLRDATHLHVKVLEQTLQQRPAGLATLNLQQPSTRTGSSQGIRLFVNSQEAEQELSDCWMQCLMAQADVDLSVAQLGNTL